MSTLSEYYTSKGQALPSVQDRTAIATQAGISGYTGTAAQNTQLLNFLQKTPSTSTSSAPTSYVVTSDNIKNVQPIRIANPNVDTSNYTSNINSVVNDLTSQVNAQQSAVDAIRAQAKNDSNTVSNLQALLGGKSADITKTYNDSGVTNLYNQLSDLNAQATGLKNEATAIPIQVQNESLGRGVTDAGVAPVTSARLRDNSLKALSLGQQAAIASANYDKAKNYADQIIEDKYSAMEADIKAKQINLESLKTYDLTPAESKLANLTAQKLKMEEAALASEKEQKKAVQDLIVKAVGQQTEGYKIPADVLAKAQKAKTPQEAAIALGQWAGDYWQTQQLKQAIELSKANLIKINAETAQTNAETTSKYTNIAGGVVAGYNISKYATDPNHESSVARLYSNLSGYNFSNASSIDQAIKSASSTSPITGQMILNAASQYGVDPKMVFAMMQQDSSLGTKGTGARNNNPGNIGQFDNIKGAVKGYPTLQDGVNAVASWLSKNKAPESVAVQNLKEKYRELDSLANSDYLSNAVGPNSLARSDFSSWYTGGKQNFLGTAQNVLSKETLDALINAKAGGATFGALSDSELKMLQTSASKLNQWAMRDEGGSITGFNIDEGSFKTELNRVMDLTKKSIERNGGSVADLNNSDLIDGYFNTLQSSNFINAGSTQMYGGYKL